MDDKKESNPDREERKIPVFTVIKNGATLKTIFAINNTFAGIKTPDQDAEETIVMGRHPDCNIVLAHPSISRFHLQIHTKPFSQKLSVTDLASVHGTWVLGTRIEAGARTELKEGDTIRVGGSSRVYRLHWVPLSLAYDLERPFLFDRDATTTEDKENENGMETFQVNNSLSGEEKNIKTLDSIPEAIAAIPSDEFPEVCVKKELQSVASLPENVMSLFNEEQRAGSLHCEFSGTASLSSNVKGSKNGKQIFTKDAQSPQFHRIKKTVPRRENCVSESPPGYDLEDGERETEVSGCSGIKFVKFSLPVEKFIAENGAKENSETHSVTKLASEGKNSPKRNPNILFNFDSSSSLEVAKCHPEIESSDLREIWSTVKATCNPTEYLNSSKSEGQILEGEDKQLDEGKQTTCNTALWKTDPLAILESGLAAEELYRSMAEKGEATKAHSKASTKGINSNRMIHLPAPVTTESVKTEFVGDVISGSVAEVQCFDDTLEKVAGTGDHTALNVNCIRGVNTIPFTVCHTAEPVKSSFSFHKVRDEVTVEQLNNCYSAEVTQKQALQSPLVKSENHPSTFSIWPRRGKRACVPKIKPGRSSRESLEAGRHPEDEVNLHENDENCTTSKAFSSDMNGKEEFSTPGKENLTSNTLMLRSIKKSDRLGSLKKSEPLKSASSNDNVNNMNPHGELLDSPDRESHTPKRIVPEQKAAKPSPENKAGVESEMSGSKGRAERVPFQSLFSNSASSPVATKGSNSASYGYHIQKNNSVVEYKRTSWIMFADSASLLDKKSRKALQLLQGIKGTSLIIPRMVIRELNDLNKRRTPFRRTEASLVLQWIEDCMVTMNWWIHIQSLEDETKLIASTPPAFTESTGGLPLTSSKLSGHENLSEVMTPVPEDCILESVLRYKKMNYDANLILVSNDVNLKIKAMAEGLLCKTAEEFRESLVNPFSNTFLWAGSSPRGQTWNCFDDVVLRDHYYSCQFTKFSLGRAKGLKLVLPHDAHCGWIYIS